MDKARARALLDEERRRLDELSRAVSRDHDDAVAGSSPEDPADGADRRLAEETTETLGERLRDRWDALERAEARLAAGTYGASVLSGRPIPDERLEAFPLADLTVDEAARTGPESRREARTGVKNRPVPRSLPGVRGPGRARRWARRGRG
jgi:DnaK suppressor protein